MVVPNVSKRPQDRLPKRRGLAAREEAERALEAVRQQLAALRREVAAQRASRDDTAQRRAEACEQCHSLACDATEQRFALERAATALEKACEEERCASERCADVEAAVALGCSKRAAEESEAALREEESRVSRCRAAETAAGLQELCCALTVERARLAAETDAQRDAARAAATAARRLVSQHTVYIRLSNSIRSVLESGL